MSLDTGTHHRTRTAIEEAVEWQRAVTSHPDALVLRGDSHASLMVITRALAASLGIDGTSSPGWSQIQKRSNLSRATVARWLRWLRQRNLITTARPAGPGQAAYLLTHVTCNDEDRSSA